MAAPFLEHKQTRAMKIFEEHTKHPEAFLEAQISLINDFKLLTKSLYDEAKFFEKENNICMKNSTALPQLITKHFDDEQIWQELELQNNSLQKAFFQTVCQATSNNALTCFERKTENFQHATAEQEVRNDIKSSDVDDSNEEENEKEDSDDCDLESDVSLVSTLKLSDESDDENSYVEENINSQKTAKKVRFSVQKKPSIVDDQFFKQSDFEEFANREAVSDDSENESEEFDSSDNENDETKVGGITARYQDFFDSVDNENEEVTSKHRTSKEIDSKINSSSDEELQEALPKQLLNLDDIGSDESDGETAEDIFGSSLRKQTSQSAFEQQQKKLQKEIRALEEENLGEKSWQLRGEISADSRPENSLLEEHLQFDHVNRQAPVITEETTKTLEDIIIQRIKDKAWDDVERKVKPTEEPFEYRRRVILDSEKSKLSLAEIYEKEYNKQQQKDEEEKEIPEHTEIKKMMDSLFYKLNALSNYHYTPKLPTAEVKVVNNLPAITVEEVAPVSMSDGALLAPEEIKAKMNWELKGADEKTATDRKRERRAKKSAQRKRKIKKEAWSKQVQIGNPILAKKIGKAESMAKLRRNPNVEIRQSEKGEKRKSMSSKEFFSQLQEKVSSQTSSRNQTSVKRKKKVKAFDSARIKL